MDQQQPSQHQQHIHDDHSTNLNATAYGFYPTEQDPSSYGLTYNTTIPPYQVVQQQHPGPPPRQLSQTDLAHQPQPGLQFHNLSLMGPHQYQAAPVYNAPPQHVVAPLSGSPPPQSPNMYNPLSPPISGSDTSADGAYHHHHHHGSHSRNSSITDSPSSSRGSLVHRHPMRYNNPTPSPTSSSSRHRRRSLRDSDEEEMMSIDLASNLAHTRKEATRRQRIEAEQRRRDELRDGYAKLKEVLPISNQKSSKVSLLERATNHIIQIGKENQEMQARLEFLEAEIKRLHKLNEKISLGVASTPSPGHPGSLPIESRPLSPPPEAGLHSLASIRGQDPPREQSRSPCGSENGF